jgi:tRNA threonylcarbamoyladenosine biosynthesis protein TsaB
VSSPETPPENNEAPPSDATKPDGEALSAPATQPTPEPVARPTGRRLLALDTALGACSVAVFDQDEDRPLAVHSIELARGHAEALLPMVEQIMRETDTAFDSVTRFVTTVGPGSFTGLRVAIAAARGFALATHKPAVGVSTLTAFCAPFQNEKDAIPVVACIDALHNNIYFQMIGAGGRVLVSPRIGSIEEALRLVAVGPVRLVGPGANLLAIRWPDVRAPMLVDPRHAPDIEWVARLGSTANPETAKPKPLYLKAPDAQPQAAHRLPRQ